MTLHDIYKMKVLGGSIILKDGTFLFVSKITGLDDEPRRGDMNILYEDCNGKKKEFKLSEVKEVHPTGQSFFTLFNNISKMKECSGYFITKERIDVSQVVSFADGKVHYLGIYDKYERNIDIIHIKEAHLTEDPLELTRGYGITRRGKKRNSFEVPLMDDDLEMIFNRTRDQNFELLRSLDYNEFEITSSQVPNDIYRIPYMSKGENKGYAVLVNRTEDAFILDLNSLFVVKPLSSHIKSLTSERYFEDIQQTPKKEKVIEVPQAPRKKHNFSNSSTVSKKLDFEEPSVDNTSVDIPTERIVTFIYKGDEKKVLVKEANDKYTEGICQTDKKYKKYLTRYIEKVNKVEDPTDASDEDISDDDKPQLNPTYMILNTIKTCYVNGTRGLSRPRLQAYIMANYNVNIEHFHKNIRTTLKKLVETGYIVQTKQKFKLGDEGRKYLKQKPMKKGKSDEKCDNEVIQDAIDNEKILDIIYDGGSIPDVKRPVRPKRVYTASNGKQILEAICLIDDKIKKFSLDKLKVIA